jgi:hypothetical protein
MQLTNNSQTTDDVVTFQNLDTVLNPPNTNTLAPIVHTIATFTYLCNDAK